MFATPWTVNRSGTWISPNQERKIAIHRVLFRRAIQLSVSSEHWAEVLTGLQGKAWGADLPKSPVILNLQFKGAQPTDVFVVPWAGGQTIRCPGYAGNHFI
jgi:hypothetical protein